MTTRTHHPRPTGHHLARWQRLSVYAVGSSLFVTGMVWLGVHYLVGAGTGELPRPLEAWCMQLHGLAAFAGLFVFGVMAAAHLPHGWRLSRRLRWAHQRRSGIVLCALAATLALSGYLLYYFAPEWVRPSWAGAMIATAFIELPWLQAMTFELTASAEYDDDGGSYRSITVAVRDVVPVNGADIPEDFGGNFDDVDAELAADEISERFDQESSLLYAAFENGSGDFSDFTFRVDRDAIAEILATGDVKGKKAFVALFPAYAYRVTC